MHSAPRFVAYYRVSTVEQGRSGLGLDAQRQAVAGLVLGRRGELLAEFTEIESGRNDDRPKLREARAMAVKAKATLLIAKLDRLARSVSFIATLMADSRLEIEACDLPQANRMTLHIMAAVAEGEAAAISSRTKAALAEAAKRGKKFGFAHDRNLELAGSARAAGLLTKRLEADRYAREYGAMVADLRGRGLTFEEIAEHFTRYRVPLLQAQDPHEVHEWKLGRVYQIYRRYAFIGPPSYGRVALSAG